MSTTKKEKNWGHRDRFRMAINYQGALANNDGNVNETVTKQKV